MACKEETAADAVDKDTSYAFGMLMASQLGLPEVVFDYDSFRDGFRDYNEARETRITTDKAMEYINNLFMRLQSAGDEQAFIEGEINREEGEAFLAANRLKDNIKTTTSGLQYEVLVEGSGEKPGPEDTVQVHYEGTLINGTVFDSSYSRGYPAEFPLYGVIQGWTEGLQLMSEGSTYMFYIPSDLAYGQSGAGSSIPPNTTLIFKVELLSIIRY
ncbi:MAG: FKBP-type peptidyl-prolyl cis-trans isomerase [Treponema sp.]|nr:FKBP-type peptidyl-prolyl cis-trans isomerase [Treponema sp.]